MIEFFKKGSQEKQFVRDTEKAREMAEIEDEYRNFAIALKDYMDDPIAFRAAEAEKVARVKERGDFTSDDSNDYMELYRAGIRVRATWSDSERKWRNSSLMNMTLKRTS